MAELLLGTTLLASFLGGVVALLAPCCVSVMLLAYLATGFRHHGGVVPATLVATSRIHHLPRGGLAGAPLLGAVYGLGWTPCLGPTLTV